MEKLFFLLSCFLGMTFLSYSQDAHSDMASDNKDGLSVKTGFLFNPQGTISFNYASDGFSTELPLYAGVSFSKMGLTITPCYEFSGNSAALFVEKLVSSKNEIGVYDFLCSNKHESVCNLGVNKTLHTGQSLFIEFGSSFSEWEPKLFMGVSIPLMFKIN